MSRRRVLIMGAAGRDFHNFNVLYRGNAEVQVVGFTATQIPNISGRRYPEALAGEGYPEGIPIFPEEDMARLIRDMKVDEVVFSYSDVPHLRVMQAGAVAQAAGARFTLPGVEETMISACVPLVSVCAIRTGCGKSQTTRAVCRTLLDAGHKVAAIRHPMPYGDLVKQRVQRFASLEDMDKAECTIEEREEYEPHIAMGTVIYAGVDYEAILREAEKEADVIVWDGGNNDTSFYRSDLEIVVVDPHRPGHELLYYPGQTNFLRAHVIVINKMGTAEAEGIATVRENIRRYNPEAVVIEADSPVMVEDPGAIAGKRVLAVEDGPTLTHGEMAYGAAVVAARQHGAAELVDPRPWVVGSIKGTFEKYPGTGSLLPAVGYGEQQVRDLEETINAVDCDLVLIGTPIDLRRIVKINKPAQRVTYELKERREGELAGLLKKAVSV
ncbi:MAG: GTPase [Acidobacteria bacterium]|nr:GTPase [Acidobacteriota bacterium]MCZ6832797.1 GTPase [Acidobacteriota bacterium]